MGSVAMTDDEAPIMAPPPKDGSGFRALVGLVVLAGALAGFAMLFFVAVPESNREPMLLALGFVMGWAGSVVQSEYGASATGRKAADQALQQGQRK